MQTFYRKKLYHLLEEPKESGEERKVFYALGVDEKGNKYTIQYNHKKYLYSTKEDFKYCTKIYKIN